MKRSALLCLALLFISTSSAWAQVKVGDRGKLSGLVFGDYYWMAQNHNAELEGNNGFWIRRIYLTYDHQISEAFSGRVRLEMDSEGDFVTDSKLEPSVKDAYLKWSNEEHAIIAGISSTPTLGLAEDIWGYRSIEKSPLDLYDFASSRDFGIAFKGNLDEADRLNYHFMFANGNSNSTELNKGKKFMLSLSYDLTDHLVIQGYGDWNDNPGSTDTYTMQGVMGYMSDNLSVGGLYAHQIRENATIDGDLELDLISVFANARLSQQLKIFSRVDHMFDPNPSGPGNDYLPISDQAESTFIAAGVDVGLHEQVHLMPNIEAVVYGENEEGVQPDTDLIPRLTLFFTF